jgi:uncharacterized protein DUF3179
VWGRTVEGKELTFHLCGINNENFIMKDEQTGSWWQQVSGAAIQGPLKGARLKRILHEDVTFATWKREHPTTRVLMPDATAQAKYAEANWEEGMAKVPVVTPRRAQEPLQDRDLVAGVEWNGVSRAYLLADLARQGPVNDRLGEAPILVLPFEEGKSVRVFDRTVNGLVLELFAGEGEESGRLVDDATGSAWDFTGRALAGPLAGEHLAPLPVLLDYWFDWKTYHPGTDVYKVGR